MICDYGLNIFRENKLEKKADKYLSLEELKNEETSIEIDKWNYGLLIYKYLSGKDLFDDKDQILKCEYEIGKDIPYLLKELLKQIFVKEIFKRMKIEKIIEILKSILFLFIYWI